ncbi:unnamed protein product [Spirodela intermedia]|uniref:Uncharacterized protein n=1 Tax=Spirodela intermedia TaxID=51605 RepID=A0A7I8ILA4_SPIIN|nr:unnamed protein product [Spirodela intermedia]CAA6657952.1 unnamed protein product [Spirodela intermedia]
MKQVLKGNDNDPTTDEKTTTGGKSDITSTGNYGSQSRNQIHRREETGKENDTRQIDPTFALIETCPAALLRRRRDPLAPSYLLGYYAACKRPALVL